MGLMSFFVDGNKNAEILGSILENYLWEFGGPSVDETGDIPVSPVRPHST